MRKKRSWGCQIWRRDKLLHKFNHLFYDNQPFFEDLSLIEHLVNGKKDRESCQKLYVIWKNTQNISVFLVLYVKLWMRLEELYMEDTERFYQKEFYEKNLFFELMEYEADNSKENLKIMLLRGYFFDITDYFFLMDIDYKGKQIAMLDGKKLIEKMYCQNPDDFLAYCFYIQMVDFKRSRKIRKNKDYQKKLDALFPTDLEIDQYFRQLF